MTDSALLACLRLYWQSTHGEATEREKGRGEKKGRDTEEEKENKDT